jgi:hypothetical protein
MKVSSSRQTTKVTRPQANDVCHLLIDPRVGLTDTFITVVTSVQFCQLDVLSVPGHDDTISAFLSPLPHKTKLN